VEQTFDFVTIASAIRHIGPEVLLLLAAAGYFVGAIYTSREEIYARVTIFVLIIALFAVPDKAAAPTLAGLFRGDEMSLFGRHFSLVTGLLLTLLSWRRITALAPEYYACLLMIVAGTSLVAAANDLVSLFLALELISIPTYILLYLPRFTPGVQEATTKYFLLSVFSSALLLYGFSFLYGAAGTTNIEGIREAMRATPDEHLPVTLIIALVMIVASLCFRVTAAPFHFYAPDVYQGGPTLGVTILALIPKIAGFVALYQVVAATLLVKPHYLGQAMGLVWIIALISMFIGNLFGLLQDNLKRLMAYSGIAHAGYMLVGFGAGLNTAQPIAGLSSVFFYLLAYVFMTLGVFAIIHCLSREEKEVESVDDLAGLGYSHPLIAFCLMVFLFSLTGLPPTQGFWAKLNIFLAAWGAGSDQQQQYRILAVLMAINAALGAWYYLRIVGVMYLRQPLHPLQTPPRPFGWVVVAFCVFIVLMGFFLPGQMSDWSTKAVEGVMTAR
jgi:NADH-quinone oxidoreductase subunit N